MLNMLLLILNISYAQSGCIQLEGLNLGCVSSVDHSCYMNKKIDRPNDPCHYVGSPANAWRVEGPIAFHCKSSRQTTTCPPKVCNADGCVQPPCTTTSECIEYFPPSCQETCTVCFNEEVTINAGISKGCIVCTRKPCADEPLVETLCPTTYNGLVLHGSQKCSSDSHCPTTATDPLGVVHTVNINKGACPEAKMPEIPPPPNPKDCPWKVDKRTATGCEAIDPDNRNP